MEDLALDRWAPVGNLVRRETAKIIQKSIIGNTMFYFKMYQD